MLKLLIRGTGEFLIVDALDWEKVRDIPWRQGKGAILSPEGTIYEQFCGIEGKHRLGSALDKRREYYIPLDKEWVYSEYYNDYRAA